ncbi:MAG: hypothetical protein KKD18_06155 [Nanoarchaeota archaeon]|nr:hypothetical protein [Nanoarchaeota archaeon]MBU0977975.1 hypothetical protein [Nanoarchaeota archaeon]
MINRKKGASLIINKTILFVLIGLVVVITLFAIFSWGIPQWFKNLLPTFFPNSTEDNTYTFALSCPVHVARIVDGKYIEYCLDDKCEKTRKTNLILNQNEILVTKPGALKISRFTPKVGIRLRGSIVIYPEIVKGIGSQDRPTAYYDVEGNLPEYYELLNLNLAYFFTKTQLCRDSRISEIELRKIAATRSIFIEGKTFYYDLDEFIQNKDEKETPLYLDNKLTQTAKSKIMPKASSDNYDGSISRVPEEGETPFEEKLTEVKLIQKSRQNYDVQLYTNPAQKQEFERGELTEDIELSDAYIVPNPYNSLGVNTDGKPFTTIKYMQKDGKVYIQLLRGSAYSPLVRMEYWNAYQSFARIPDWAKL